MNLERPPDPPRLGRRFAPASIECRSKLVRGHFSQSEAPARSANAKRAGRKPGERWLAQRAPLGSKNREKRQREQSRRRRREGEKERRREGAWKKGKKRGKIARSIDAVSCRICMRRFCKFKRKALKLPLKVWIAFLRACARRRPEKNLRLDFIGFLYEHFSHAFPKRKIRHPFDKLI